MAKFILFSQEGCVPCKDLKKTLIKSAGLKVSRNPDKGDVYEVNLDIDEHGRALAMHVYRIAVTPTLIMLDDEGQEVNRSRGNMSYEDFLAFVNAGERGV